MIALRLAAEADAPMIHAMQLRAFMPLYEKYRDHETSPATESVDRVRARILDPLSKYWIITADGEPAGAIRVQKTGGDSCRISPIFVLPEFQGRGIAQQAMRLAEGEFPEARRWTLDTILQEKGNCRLYEKMGYVRTGDAHEINGRMTLIDYAKRIEK